MNFNNYQLTVQLADGLADSENTLVQSLASVQPLTTLQQKVLKDALSDQENFVVPALSSAGLAAAFIGIITGISKFASYTGTPTGATTPVTITANTIGTGGNSITITFDGVETITAAIAAWNLAHPTNQATLTSGDGTQVPSAGSVSLSGGITGTTVTITANNAGSIGNAVALVFNGTSTTITAAISTWNTANPSNHVTLTSGSGSQIPGAQTLYLTTVIGGSKGLNALQVKFLQNALSDMYGNLTAAINAGTNFYSPIYPANNAAF